MAYAENDCPRNRKHPIGYYAELIMHHGTAKQKQQHADDTCKHDS